MVGKTGEDKTGIISGDVLNVNLESPTYFDFQNKRIGSETNGIVAGYFKEMAILL